MCLRSPRASTRERNANRNPTKWKQIEMQFGFFEI